MSRYAEALAPVLKVLVVVVIIAAWVEANADRIQRIEQDTAPPLTSAFSKAPPAPGFDPFRRAETEPRAADSCSPAVGRRNVTRVVPARPAVIKT